MPLRVFLAVMLIAPAISGMAEDESKPPGATWAGSVSVGAELDERALPRADEEKKPGRIRLGFSASWSFSLHWDRVEPDTDKDRQNSPELSPEEAKVIELTNAERKKLKLPSLKSDPVLMKLARTHSATMARLDQIGHELEGKSFSQRLNAADYQAMRAGENIAQGQRTPSEAVAGWMKSPGHKGNILQADYTRIGVGQAKSKSGKMYWTQVFAKP